MLITAVYEKTGVLPINLPVLEESPADTITTDEISAIALTPEAFAAFAEFAGFYDFGDGSTWELVITETLMAWIGDGQLVVELTPMSDGSFMTMFGPYTFTMYGEEAVSTLNTPMGPMIGIRIETTDIEMSVVQDFSAWIGIYHFVPAFENDFPFALYFQLELVAGGMPYVTIRQRPFAGSAPLLYFNNRWIIGVHHADVFTDDDGNKFLSLDGAVYQLIIETAPPQTGFTPPPWPTNN